MQGRRSLRERLERLDRNPRGRGLTSGLRERLERVWDTRPPQGAGQRPPLERFVRGSRVPTPAGPVFRTEVRFGSTHRHGRFPLGALERLPGSGLRELLDELCGVACPDQIAFLDTETTGLAGGAGTVAFLVGVGRWIPGARAFQVVQLFLEDLDREPALLSQLARELAGVRCVVTYNGRRFDVPLLRNRCVLNRRPGLLDGAAHLDLLPLSRSLWRLSQPDCRLATLERGVLGVARGHDVPGWEIPSVYTRYLRLGPDARLGAVFRHNRLDILSLAGLFWAADRAARRPADDEAYGLGLLRARRRHRGACEALERCLDGELPPEARIRALRELGFALKREARWEEALEAWTRLERLAPADPVAVEERAKILEHRLGRPAEALEVVERALARAPWGPSDRSRLEHRRTRLARKVGAGAPRGTR